MATKDKFWGERAAPQHKDAAWCMAILAEVTYTNDAAVLRRFADIFGFKWSQFIPTPDRVTPNVMICGDDDRLLVAIPGTTNRWQMRDNIIYSAMDRDRNYGQGAIHSYFLWCAKSIVSHVANLIPTYPDLQKITFVGHSLGGAVAQILARYADIQYPGKVKVCYAFNSPRAGSHLWATEARGFDTFHFYSARDPVCELPPKMVIPLTAITGAEAVECDWSHVDQLIAVPSSRSMIPALGATGVSWGGGAARGAIAATSAASTARNFAGLASQTFIWGKISSWALSLYPWYQGHLISNLVADIADQEGFQFPEEGFRLLQLIELIGGDVELGGVPISTLPTPINPLNFAPGRSPTPGPMSGLPTRFVGEVFEVFEAGVQWIEDPDRGQTVDIRNAGQELMEAVIQAARAADPALPPIPNVLGPPVPPRPHWVYRSQDRNILEWAVKTFDAIYERDRLASLSKPTAKISTRELVIGTPELQEAFEAVYNQLITRLYLYYEKEP